MRSIEAIDFDARKSMINLAVAADIREGYDSKFRVVRKIQEIDFDIAKSLRNLTGENI